MPRYIDTWTGDEVEITCLASREGEEPMALLHAADGGGVVVINQTHMNDRYRIVTPQTIELKGNAIIGSGAH